VRLGGRSGLARATNPKFSGVELENELAEIARREEKGGVERGLMLGMTLGLALADP
jgi:hypothetical protein